LGARREGFSNSRFSDIEDITASNVAQLGVRVTFSTGVVAGHEAAPLVVNGTMYVVAPWPNRRSVSVGGSPR
jgi:alcohol dehydrogenase (cytochrome c)